MSRVHRHTEVIDQEDRFVGGWLARERVLSAVAETVEKAAVPRAGGGGSEQRVEEWSSPAGLSRARRRELRAGRGAEGEWGGGLATDLQYRCARSRSPFACRLVSTHVEPFQRVLARQGWDSMMMRVDDGAVASLWEGTILEIILLFRRRSCVALIFFF